MIIVEIIVCWIKQEKEDGVITNRTGPVVNIIDNDDIENINNNNNNNNRVPSLHQPVMYRLHSSTTTTVMPNHAVLQSTFRLSPCHLPRTSLTSTQGNSSCMYAYCTEEKTGVFTPSPQKIISITFLPCDAMRCTVSVIVILSVCPSVRLSVCLSHSWTVSTWFDLRS